jgi:hypothetical protein
VPVGSEDDRTRQSMERCSRQQKKQRRRVARGGPSLGGARGGRLGATRPAVASVEVHGVAAVASGAGR